MILAWINHWPTQAINLLILAFFLPWCSSLRKASLTLWNECVSHVQMQFVTAWMVDRQAPPSMEFSRQNILEWVAMPSSRGSSQPRDWSASLESPALAGCVFTTSATWEAPVMNKYIHKVSCLPQMVGNVLPSLFLFFCLFSSFLPFFSFLVFLFSFFDNQNGPHILFFVLYYSRAFWCFNCSRNLWARPSFWHKMSQTHLMLTLP